MWSDLAGVLGAGLSLLGLGFVMGFSPTMYAVVIRLLTASKRPQTAVRWVSVGMVIGCTLMLLAFRVVDPETLTAALKDRVEEFLVRRGVDLVAGTIFLILAVITFQRLRRPRPAPKLPGPPREESARRMILIGVANTVIGISGLATMYVTGRVLTSATHQLWLQALLYTLFLVAVIGPYLLLSLAWQRYPRLDRQVRSIYHRLSRLNTRALLAFGLSIAAFGFFGVGLFGHGH
ncbi:GAP family protein [Naumannella halotolerans]|uniref:Sap-like sulfolipid-1-addressing protein n=1 Tax=Naumannella halotolerans TaxID=993414 RepID=A0A4R7J757_9ACTN|nr:GAP family protein [Naumannella halotolerans]TDT33260.1 hypothetical protein CLV29_0865 [Naumannella halotolerans]